MDEESRHPDQDGQFERIKSPGGAKGWPAVISVDTKKKELVGNYKNAGSDYRSKGTQCRVKMHDFEDKTQGKVAPYGAFTT